MGRSKMSSLKITLLPLAICLLLSLNSQVSGKPSPKHFLIETKEEAKTNKECVKDITNHGVVNKVIDASTNFDYVNNIKNSGGIGGVVDRSTNFDYVNNIKNGPGIGGVVDRSTNLDYVNNIKNGPGASIHKVKDLSTNFKDYITIDTANNQGVIEQNNNNHYWGKK